MIMPGPEGDSIRATGGQVDGESEFFSNSLFSALSALCPNVSSAAAQCVAPFDFMSS
jgi:hypothetical protein